jgi:hypothetical protein
MNYKYLDIDKLNAIDVEAFKRREPYPWVNPFGLIKEEAFKVLTENLPDFSMFSSEFGMQRKYGQKSHDRFALEYNPTIAVPEPWKEFAKELTGPDYKKFLRKIFGRRFMLVKCHWHFSISGCSVSPHTDGKQKIGSHIFYLNTPDEWKNEWGGSTLVLSSKKNISEESSPEFSDFDSVTTSDYIGNYSFIFAKTDKSWHGVKELTCPPGKMRKVFIVVIDTFSLKRFFLNRFKKEKKEFYL